MQVVTLSRSHRLVGAECRHCHRQFVEKDQVLTHAFGKDAPWDLKHFSVHAVCARHVINRAPKPRTGPNDKAAQFRAEIERIRAGGPVLVLNG